MKLFVWDFHGVLEKGNEYAVLEMSNQILRQFGYRQRFSLPDCVRLYGLKWYQYFEDLLPHESHQRHLELQNACVLFSNKNHDVVMRYMLPNDHVVDVLEAIARGQHQQILISNTAPEALKKFVETAGLQIFFGPENSFAVNAHSTHSKSSKEAVLREYIAGKQFDSIIIIGDSPGDIELCNVNGGVTYLYSHPYLPFRSHHQATYLINDLRKVLQEV